MVNFEVMYLNGNYVVYISRFNTLFETRTFTSLRLNEKLMPDFPDSIDLKITNKCSWGCPFCHESSNPKGKSFNFDRTIKMLDSLPSLPIEVAIGGGNIFECYEDFGRLYQYLDSRGICPRFTINAKDLLDEEKSKLISELVHGSINKPSIGISIKNKAEFTECMKKLNLHNLFLFNAVFHVIVGIFPFNELEDIIKNYNKVSLCKFLILGYKQFGRASNSEINDLDNWRSVISKLLMKNRITTTNITIGFDNLAVDQLNIKDCLFSNEWDSYFLGQDFSHTMYVDAVEETFAPTSRSPLSDRVSWDKYNNNIVDYFKKNKKEWN